MTRWQLIWTEENGILSFEWTLLLTLLTLGIVGGLAAARDAIIDELGDVAEAAQAFDQSYSLDDFDISDGMGGFIFTHNPSIYTETAADQVFVDCARANGSNVTGQAAANDTDS